MQKPTLTRTLWTGVYPSVHCPGSCCTCPGMHGPVYAFRLRPSSSVFSQLVHASSYSEGSLQHLLCLKTELQSTLNFIKPQIIFGHLQTEVCMVPNLCKRASYQNALFVSTD